MAEVVFTTSAPPNFSLDDCTTMKNVYSAQFIIANGQIS